MNTVRGTIVRVPDQSPGLLVANGQQFAFHIQGVWRSAVAPSLNQTVEAKVDATGTVLELEVLDPQRVAFERLEQLGTVASEGAKRAASVTSQRLSSLSFGGKGKLIAAGAAVCVFGGVALLVAIQVVGALFGDGLSKGALKDQINAQLEREGPVCWPEGSNGASRLKFPFFVETVPGFVGGVPPIVAGLVNGGYLSATPNRQTFGAGNVYALTPKGEQAKVWDAQHGFCVGKKQVDEVTDWTAPGEGENATRVNFKWKIGDRSSWVDDEAFAAVPGLVEPVQSFSIAQKTNEGWKVVF